MPPMRAMRLHLRVTVQGRLQTERAPPHHTLKLPLCGVGWSLLRSQHVRDGV